MTSNTQLLPCGTQLTTAPSFTLSFFLNFHLVILFLILLVGLGGEEDTQSDVV